MVPTYPTHNAQSVSVQMRNAVTKQKPKPRGRPRKVLPGGHKKRRPNPTQNAKLNAAVRDMSRPVPAPDIPKRKATEQDGTYEVDARGRRIFRLKKGHTLSRGKHKSPRVPRSIRASVKAILERVVKTKGTTVERAIIDGIDSGPRHADRYLRLAAEYVDGKPVDTVHLHAQFNQTELNSARQHLGAKLSSMLATLLARDTEK